MNILYSGDVSKDTSCLYRMQALERLGHHVTAINSLGYRPRNRFLRSLAFRLVSGTHVSAYNADLLALAKLHKPDVFWADKVLILRSETLLALRAMGIKTVSYMIDNAFGPRNDPGWRLYRKNIPLYDLHVTQRDVSVADYMSRGARHVLKVQTAYEPTIHYPPTMPVPDDLRVRGVSFIGTPYDNRAEIFTHLAEADLPVTISGNTGRWQTALQPEIFAKIFREGELYGQAYREAIWHSKINLSFITHSNQDEYAHKSFEIAACGGFLLAERSAGHSLKFKEDEEAVFFSDEADLIKKIRHYLPNAEERDRIALAGQKRAAKDGYYNDAQVGKILEKLNEIEV